MCYEICGFTRAIRYIIVTAIEIWAIKDGFHLAHDLGIRNVMIECDSEAVIFYVEHLSIDNS